MNKKEIKKKDPLGGSGQLKGEDKTDYSPEATKKVLDELGLAPVQSFEVENEVTGKRSIVTIERDGTPESKLVMALADKGMKRDQKDAVLSMYLFERGKENSSFLMDLFRYKGSHTKDTQAFKSQMRFDFEMFVNMFTNYLDMSAREIFKEIGIKDGDAFLEQYVKYAEEAKENASMGSFTATMGNALGDAQSALARVALRNMETAKSMRMSVQKVTENRMKQKGYGIYIGADGRSFSIFDDKDDIAEAVRKDIERIQGLNEE